MTVPSGPWRPARLAGVTAVLVVVSMAGASAAPGPTGPFPAIDADAAELVQRVRAEDGFTVDPRDGRAPRSGYAVNTGVGARVERAAEFFGGRGFATGQARLRRFVRDRARSLRANPRLCVGAWYDRAGGLVVLSTVEVVPDRATAIRLGLAHRQRSVFDLSARREVPTGGPGRSWTPH